MILLAGLLALTPVQTARIDAIVKRVMLDQRIAGLSLGVARRGSRLYLRGYGVRDPSQRLPADGYTIYDVGSVTKQFTAALVLQEVADGRLALDGGSPPVRSLLDQIHDGQWRYDNRNYARLGTLLERAAHAPFCTLLTQRIVAPLDLFSTSCGRPPSYAWNVAVSSGPRSPPIAPAAGGMWSNARDLLRWLDALQRGRVVTPALFSAMTASSTLPDGTPANYGFGFFVDDWYGYRVVHHDGMVDGFSCMDALVLDDGLEIALLANAPQVDLDPLARSIAAIADRPRDANLSATTAQPAENERAQITADVNGILSTAAFAALGKLRTLEFIERRQQNGVTYDLYRATFATAVRRVTVGYRDGTVVSLTVEPWVR